MPGTRRSLLPKRDRSGRLLSRRSVEPVAVPSVPLSPRRRHWAVPICSRSAGRRHPALRCDCQTLQGSRRDGCHPPSGQTVTTGALSVTSTPPGASIVLDGADSKMTTPATLTGVSAGSHTVLLGLTGYADSPTGRDREGGSHGDAPGSSLEGTRCVEASGRTVEPTGPARRTARDAPSASRDDLARDIHTRLGGHYARRQGDWQSSRLRRSSLHRAATLSRWSSPDTSWLPGP